MRKNKLEKEWKFKKVIDSLALQSEEEERKHKEIIQKRTELETQYADIITNCKQADKNSVKKMPTWRGG